MAADRRRIRWRVCSPPSDFFIIGFDFSVSDREARLITAPNQTNREPDVAVVAHRAKVARVEDHVARAKRVVSRTRPIIVALGADVGDRRIEAGTGGREKDRSGGLQGFPLVRFQGTPEI